MKANFASWSKRPTSPIAEALEMHAQVMGENGHVDLLLGYTPVARMNPYQALLYQEFPSHGIAASPIPTSWDFDKIVEMSSLGTRVGVHFHWLSFVLQGITDRAVASQRIADFDGKLRSFRGRGGIVIWTIHNLLPHDAILPDHEMQLRKLVGQQSDLIHIMESHSVARLVSDLDLDPERVVVAPHPSYGSSYANQVSRTEARFALGIEPDDFVFLAFGALKPYKGLSILIDALELTEARAEVPVTLLVAGGPDDSAEAQAFVRSAEVHPRVRIAAANVPNDRVQYYMKAADTGLAAYTRVLNSGALLLYQTFGLPVVASHSAAAVGSAPEGAVHIWDGISSESLADTMLRAINASKPRSGLLAETMRGVAPELVSASFADSIMNKLGNA